MYSELDPAVRTTPALGKSAYGRPHAAYLVYIPWRFRYRGTGTWVPQLWVERVRAIGAALQVHWMPTSGL